MNYQNMTKTEAINLIKNYGAKYYKFLSNDLRADYDILSLALKERWEPFIFASKELRKDENLILQAVTHSAKALIYVDKKSVIAKLLAPKLIKANVDSIKYVGLCTISKKLALDVVKNPTNPYLLYLSDEHKKDPEVVLAAIKANWLNIRSAKVFNNQITETAVSASWNALQYIPDEYKTEKLFILAYIQNKWAIKYFPQLLNNPQIISLVLENPAFDGRILAFLPTTFQDNKEIVLNAITKTNNAYILLPFISNRLRIDFDVMNTITSRSYSPLALYEINFDYTNNCFVFNTDYIVEESKTNGAMTLFETILQYFINQKNFLKRVLQNTYLTANACCKIYDLLPQKLQADTDFILFLIDTYSETYYYGKERPNDDFTPFYNYLPPFISKNKDFCSELLKISSYFITAIDKELQNDIELIKYTIDRNPSVLYSLTNYQKDVFYNYLRENKSYCINLIKYNNDIFKVLPEDLRYKYEIIELVLDKNLSYFDLLPKNLQSVFKDKMLSMCEEKLSKQHTYGLSSLPQLAKENPEICLKALTQDERNIYYVSDKLKDDKDFMSKAIKISNYCYSHASTNVKSDPDFIDLAKSLGIKI